MLMLIYVFNKDWRCLKKFIAFLQTLSYIKGKFLSYTDGKFDVWNPLKVRGKSSRG